MSYALIDNATLTAVQRILGMAQSRSRDSVDGDIAALENLVEAILFYDDLVCIDDYKEEYRVQRKQAFNFLTFLDPTSSGLNEIKDQAQNETDRMRPTIRGGEFSDEDFRGFLERLRMHIICTWDISSSVYYLTMKMLGQPNTNEFTKYGQLSASIFSELLDSQETNGPDPYRNNYQLIDSQGTRIQDGYRIPMAKWGDGSTGGLRAGLRSFVAALNWLAFKTIYYDFAARVIRADLFLYPIRQAFHIRWMQKVSIYDADFTTSLIKSLSKHATEEIEAVVQESRPYKVSLDLPFFSAWLVTEAGDVSKVLDAAVELRKDDRFLTARQQLSDLHDRLESSNGDALRKVNELKKEIESSIKQIRADCGIGEAQRVSTRSLIKVYNAIGPYVGLPNVPELDLKIPIPKFMKGFAKKKGMACLYRDIGRDLADIPRLGRARDLLGKKVRLYRDGEAAYNPRAELPEYRYAHSQWKSPM